MNRSKREAWYLAAPDRHAERSFRGWFRRMRGALCPVQLWEPLDRLYIAREDGGMRWNPYNPAQDTRSRRPMLDLHGNPIRCGARFDHSGNCPNSTNPRQVITFEPLTMFTRLMLACETYEGYGGYLPPRADLFQLARWLHRQPTT